MDKMKILIAGGDLRQISCAEALSRRAAAAAVGFDPELLPEGLVPADQGGFNCAVLPVPPLTDKGSITSPCFKGTLTPEDIRPLLAPGALILAGRIGEDLSRAFPGHRLIDYMQREELSLNNAVPTAEGAVAIALEELPVTLSGAKVLIVGMGRIGTALAEILKGFGADVSVVVRNPRGAARARIHGIKPLTAGTMGTDWTVVFNTVPDMIFDREVLRGFSTETLFIDLASKPGGIDFQSASELGITAIWALGLPGRTAPVTAGQMIAETVELILSEEGGQNV